MVPDRRQHQRLAPSSPQLVLFEESKYSLLFDLSESGLAVEGFAAQDPNRTIPLAFDMPEGGGCIQSNAALVWTSDSGNRTGFRFLDLSDTSRQQLRDWILVKSAARFEAIDSEVAAPTFGTATADTGPQPLGVEDKPPTQHAPESSAFRSQPVIPPPLQRPFAHQDETFGSRDSATHRAPLFVAAVVMSALAFIFGYSWRAGRSRPVVGSIKAVAGPLKQPSGVVVPSAPQSPAPEAIPPLLPLDNPGFVLQTGAMEKETNADALSAELRKRNFSAFVFHRSTDRFYRVAVGPYTDQRAAIQIKNDLEQEGYKPILRPWSPQ
jgi:hypothetical protein